MTETIEVVIRLSKDLYKGIKHQNGELETEYVCDELMKAVDNGTPLPKGHGRLIDADTYRKEMLDSREFDFFKRLDMQPTIIEAEKDGDAD